MKRRSTWPDKDDIEKVKRRRETDQHSSATPVSTSCEQTFSVQTHAKNFVHEPFEDSRSQIRLLRMLPSSNSNEDRLQYSISTYDFNRVGEFIAISYTWGDPNNEQVVHIDDKICPVRRNCYYVLKNIYQHWKLGRIQADLLWIDSVCINQKDREEKSIQVSFMGEIYAKAAEVLACVGPHADDSEFVFEKASEVNELRYECSHNEDYLCQDCRSPWEGWVQSLGIERLTRLCISCQTFGRRLYWTRIWIIQEVAKARSLRILCGTDILPWTAIHNLEDFLAMEMDEIESVFTTYQHLPNCDVNSMHDVFRAKKEPLRIEQVFSQFSDSSCSEPRDRLYGLLGLIDWANELEPIFPDYEASIFDVAVQVAPHFSSEQIPEMLAAFQITSEDKTVQRLIRQRRQVIDIGERNTPMDAARDSKSLYNDIPINKVIPAMCAYLQSDEDDNMTALLKKSEFYIGSTPSDFGEASDSCTEEAFSPEVPKQSASAMASLLSPTSLETRPKPLVLGSEVVGYVCNKARERDILVSLSNLSRCILVMRQNQGEIYDVVGQGLLLQEYEFGCNAGVYEDSTEVALFSAQIELKIAAEDVMLLFVMDIENTSRSNDLDDCWQHALTNVTSTSLRTARVTERTQMLAKDVVVNRRDSIPHWPTILENHSRRMHGDIPAQYNGWITGLNDDPPEELTSSAEK